jgi:hypothetical protein
MTIICNVLDRVLWGFRFVRPALACLYLKSTMAAFPTFYSYFPFYLFHVMITNATTHEFALWVGIACHAGDCQNYLATNLACILPPSSSIQYFVMPMAPSSEKSPVTRV